VCIISALTYEESFVNSMMTSCCRCLGLCFSSNPIYSVSVVLLIVSQIVFCSCFLCAESDHEATAVLVTSRDTVAVCENAKVDVILSAEEPVLTVESRNNVS